MKITLVILLILITDNLLAQEQLPVPREVVEWCLECQDTKQLLERTIQNKDDIIANKNLTIDALEIRISNSDSRVEKLIEESTLKDEILANDEIIIGKYKKEVKKIKTNRWMERFIIIGGVVVAILITK